MNEYRERLENAIKTLEIMAEGHRKASMGPASPADIQNASFDYLRLKSKAEGVRLALGYLDEVEE
jgi:hypothetical protein